MKRKKINLIHFSIDHIDFYSQEEEKEKNSLKIQIKTRYHTSMKYMRLCFKDP